MTLGRLKRCRELLLEFGVDPLRTAQAARALPQFILEYARYRRQVRYAADHGQERFRLRPMLVDRYARAGEVQGHYFYQDLWAARLVYHHRPKLHLDVGSRLDGFVAHLLTFMPVTVIDVRPLKCDLTELTFLQQDATTLHGVGDETVESMSCLHAAEHFGLGRYGDTIDPSGTVTLAQELQRVLAGEGRLYFSVPIGRPRIEFNAHRVFDPLFVVTQLFSKLTLVTFAAVDDAGTFHGTAAPGDFIDAEYACGLYQFQKRASVRE